MADPDPIRAALTEAIREAMWIGTNFDKLAEAALSVVESWAPTKPCPDRWHEHNRPDSCPHCDGTGLVASDVPGIIELLCEQVGWVRTAGGGRPTFNALWELGPQVGAVPIYRLRERPDP